VLCGTGIGEVKGVEGCNVDDMDDVGSERMDDVGSERVEDMGGAALSVAERDRVGDVLTTVPSGIDDQVVVDVRVMPVV
jgi:hypothetical protein